MIENQEKIYTSAELVFTESDARRLQEKTFKNPVLMEPFIKVIERAITESKFEKA